MRHISLALLAWALVISLSPSAEAQPQETRRGDRQAPVTSETPATPDGLDAREGRRARGSSSKVRSRRDLQGARRTDGDRAGQRKGAGARRRPDARPDSARADSARPSPRRSTRARSARAQARMKRGRTARQLGEARRPSKAQGQRPFRTQRAPRGAVGRSDNRSSRWQRSEERRVGARGGTDRSPERFQRQPQRRRPSALKDRSGSRRPRR